VSGDDARSKEDKTMTRTRRWRVDVFVDEVDQTTTRAEARLHTDDDTRLVGHGEARRHPADAGVPWSGDEIAAGPVLLRLAGTLRRDRLRDAGVGAAGGERRSRGS
jgi:hypothetical protein